jgi:hypothetical protein
VCNGGRGRSPKKQRTYLHLKAVCTQKPLVLLTTSPTTSVAKVLEKQRKNREKKQIRQQNKKKKGKKNKDSKKNVSSNVRIDGFENTNANL